MTSPISSPLPRIAVIGTGGTIAGAAASAAQTTGYQAGALTVSHLRGAVPALGFTEFVLLVAAAKAIVEDRKRHREDRITNNSTAHVVARDGAPACKGF